MKTFILILLMFTLSFSQTKTIKTTKIVSSYYSQYNGNTYHYICNIALNKRTIYHNIDGTISTILSISVNIDGYEVLIPTINDKGEKLSVKQSINLYKKTGKHLGKYKTVSEANYAAICLHNLQEKMYK